MEFTGLGGSEPEYRVGAAVTVLHPSGRPDQARIDSNQELWLGPIAVGAFGLVFAVVGYFAVRFKF